MEKFNSYKSRAEKRFKETGLLPRPLTDKETEEFFEILIKGDNVDSEIEFLGRKVVLGNLLKELISNEVARGTFPESYKKAEYLYKLIKGDASTKYISAAGHWTY
jgi:aconitate hydratase 2/2-methylisocitrate dehydratase